MLPEPMQAILEEAGVAFSGVADLSPVEEAARGGMPYGILIAMPYTREAILENFHDEMRRYYAEYHALNARLAEAAQALVKAIERAGYRAHTGSPTLEPDPTNGFRTPLPHKTVATLSGVGWIGKCALLVTREYGSAIRLTTVMTDMPLEAGTPVNESACPRGCNVCKDICPGKAIQGPNWRRGMERAEYYDVFACEGGAKDRAEALLHLPKRSAICGLCIAVCPFTRGAYHY